MKNSTAVPSGAWAKRRVRNFIRLKRFSQKWRRFSSFLAVALLSTGRVAQLYAVARRAAQCQASTTQLLNNASAARTSTTQLIIQIFHCLVTADRLRGTALRGHYSPFSS